MGSVIEEEYTLHKSVFFRRHIDVGKECLSYGSSLTFFTFTFSILHLRTVESKSLGFRPHFQDSYSNNLTAKMPMYTVELLLSPSYSYNKNPWKKKILNVMKQEVNEVSRFRAQNVTTKRFFVHSHILTQRYDVTPFKRII